MRIPAKYRPALRTWVQNNIHKAAHVSEEYYKTDGYEEDGTPIISGPYTDTYIDLHEIALRIGRKIWKSAPVLRGSFDLEDLEELVNENVALLLTWSGADSVGDGGRRFSHYVNEDPDA